MAAQYEVGWTELAASKRDLMLSTLPQGGPMR